MIFIFSHFVPQLILTSIKSEHTLVCKLDNNVNVKFVLI